jgi:hypothetical protein
MKHTQGEWIVDDGFQRQQEHIAALTDDLGNPDRHWVAVGIADEDGFAESVAYCHPDNAPLISSAPELLAALQALLHAQIDPMGTKAAKACSQAYLAIAKATEAGL